MSNRIWLMVTCNGRSINIGSTEGYADLNDPAIQPVIKNARSIWPRGAITAIDSTETVIWKEFLCNTYTKS